jgi:hypothetical protein
MQRGFCLMAQPRQALMALFQQTLQVKASIFAVGPDIVDK